MTALALATMTWWALAGTPTEDKPVPAVRIQFHGRSTLHDFHGTASAPTVMFQLRDGTWSAAAKVQVSGMDTANAKRDGKMRQMFEAAAFPTIRGVVTNAPVPVTGTTNITMELQIRDVTRPVTVTISDWQARPGGYQFHGTGTVSLKEFGLKPPSVMGMIRVADAVTLETDVIVGEAK